MGLFGKKKDGIDIAIEIIKGLIERLENIRVLKSSTRTHNDIMEDLKNAAREYDEIILRVISSLYSLFLQMFDKKQFKIVEKNILSTLNKAKIIDDYVLNEEKYLRKLEYLNFVLGELIALKEGKLKINTTEKKVNLKEKNYVKAA